MLDASPAARDLLQQQLLHRRPPKRPKIVPAERGAERLELLLPVPLKLTRQRVQRFPIFVSRQGKGVHTGKSYVFATQQIEQKIVLSNNIQ